MIKSVKYIIGTVALAFLISFKYSDKSHSVSEYKIGQKIDSLNGVYVYYNGPTSNVNGRNTTKDGYNIGLKYQCVEFVKRHYYEYLNHKMPDSYGHARSFFDKNLKDGQLNKNRNLVQYSNPSKTLAQVNDIIIFDSTTDNTYGHVAIISQVKNNSIEIIQQNPVPQGNPRDTFNLNIENGQMEILAPKVLGLLRKE